MTTRRLRRARGSLADLTVRENIEFYADLYRVPRGERPARIERLYLTFLSRLPDSAERERSMDHVRRKRGEPSAYEDLFWVLVNSTEFFFNH